MVLRSAKLKIMWIDESFAGAPLAECIHSAAEVPRQELYSVSAFNSNSRGGARGTVQADHLELSRAEESRM